MEVETGLGTRLGLDSGKRIGPPPAAGTRIKSWPDYRGDSGISAMVGLGNIAGVVLIGRELPGYYWNVMLEKPLRGTWGCSLYPTAFNSGASPADTSGMVPAMKTIVTYDY